MFSTFIRASILFVAAVLAVRVMGKREVGQLQPFELVIAIMIADLATTPMEDVGIPLVYGIVPLIALVLLHSLITFLSLKSQKVRTLISGAPVVVMKDGVVLEKELKRMCFSLSDLLEELRMQGFLNPAEVGTAIMETGGKVSVFPKALYRPVTPNDMALDTSREGIPLTLILDGRLQSHNMQLGGLTENWLLKRIQIAGTNTFKEVFFCSVDTSGKMMVQAKNKTEAHFCQALNDDEIRW